MQFLFAHATLKYGCYRNCHTEQHQHSKVLSWLTPEKVLKPAVKLLAKPEMDPSLWLTFIGTCSSLCRLPSQTHPVTSAGPSSHDEYLHKRHCFQYNKPLLGWLEREVDVWPDINKLYPWSHEENQEGIKIKCNEESSFGDVESNYRWLSRRITWCMHFRNIWWQDLISHYEKCTKLIACYWLGKSPFRMQNTV